MGPSFEDHSGDDLKTRGVGDRLSSCLGNAGMKDRADSGEDPGLLPTAGAQAWPQACHFLPEILDLRPMTCHWILILIGVLDHLAVGIENAEVEHVIHRGDDDHGLFTARDIAHGLQGGHQSEPEPRVFLSNGFAFPDDIRNLSVRVPRRMGDVPRDLRALGVLHRHRVEEPPHRDGQHDDQGSSINQGLRARLGVEPRDPAPR